MSSKALDNATVHALTQIWQRVLQRSPIGPEDDFFDLDGKDSSADSIFAEIRKEYGRDLPSATICHAPTIAALAAVLEQPELPQFSPFVPLTGGNRNPPIFIAHGLGGRSSFSLLAKQMRTGHPVYGIQAKGVDGLEEPLENIEEMAEFYLGSLNQLQPEGPYVLIGYSFGGLVALEMAQRLTKRGQHVALLAMVDTYPHPRYLPPGQRLWLITKKVLGHVSNMKRMPAGDVVSYVVGGLKKRLNIAGDPNSSSSATQNSRLSFAQTTLSVKESDLRAMRRYRPHFYQGEIKFVRPEANSYLPNDPTSVWKKLVSRFEVETVPGDHLGMIGTHYEALAAVLIRFVEEAVDRK
jgi:acetoacetyl-CoA synthetase